MSNMKKHSYPRCDYRTVGAFTLIELLVVIAIIAILAAILIPVAQSVRTSSAAAVSQSNMRQLGILFQQYQADHNYQLPPAAHNFEGKRVVWDKYLAAYASDAELRELLFAPADSLPRRWSNQYPRSYSMVRTRGLGTASISYVESPPAAAQGFNITDPTGVLLLVERISDTNVVFGDSASVTDNPDQQLANGADMYGGKFNYLYLDGHVEFVEPESTIGNGSMGAPGGAWTIRITD